MEFFVTTASAARQRTDCAIVGVYDKGVLSSAAEELDKRIGGRIARLVKRGDLRGKTGDAVLLADLTGAPVRTRHRPRPRRTQRVQAQAVPQGARQRARHASARTGASDAVSYLGLDESRDADAYALARIAVEVAANSQYRIPDHKTSNKRPKPSLTRFGIAVAEPQRQDGNAERGIAHGEGIVAGMALMRDLANQPANVCTPGYLAKAAKTLARELREDPRARAERSRNAAACSMGSFLSVTDGTRGAGVPHRARVPRRRSAAQAPTALIGKGVTFDTGGISLKPPPAMDEMKFDMSGAASVLGTFKAVAELDLPINLVGVVPACENMPSGRATKPGDIVKSMSGSDDRSAQHRRRRPPDPLRRDHLRAPLQARSRDRHRDADRRLRRRARQSSAPACSATTTSWPRRSKTRAAAPTTAPGTCRSARNTPSSSRATSPTSPTSPAAKAARSPRPASWRKFTDGLKWAHLDVAGTAYVGGAHKGSTGRPVPLLVDYLINK